ALAFGLGHSAETDQVVGLDTVEIVLGLRVDHAEHRIGIALALDMRDAQVIARNRNLCRLGCSPAGRNQECTASSATNTSHGCEQPINGHCASVDFFPPSRNAPVPSRIALGSPSA